MERETIINRTLKWHITGDPDMLNQIEMTPEHILYNSGIPRIGAFATKDVEFGENVWICEGIDIRRSKVFGSVVMVGVEGCIQDSEINGVVNIGHRQNDPENLDSLFMQDSKISGCFLAPAVDSITINNSNLMGNFYFNSCGNVDIHNSVVGHNIKSNLADRVNIVNSRVDGNIILEGDGEDYCEFNFTDYILTGNNYIKANER